jgi:MFS superfamily sulfate permease-like transporter
MIDIRALRDIRQESPSEFYLAIATTAAVIAIGVEQGILLAIALSLLQHVNHSYRPHSMMRVPNATGRWMPVPATPGKETAPGLIIFRFGGDLFYANISHFTDEVLTLIENSPTPVRWLIIDASAITDIDYSAAQSLRDLLNELTRRGVRVVFGRVTQYLRSDLDRHSITAAVGAAGVFRTLHEAIATTTDRSPPIGSEWRGDDSAAQQTTSSRQSP